MILRHDRVGHVRAELLLPCRRGPAPHGAEVGDHPEVRLKRDLWDGLLRQVYGDEVGSDVKFCALDNPDCEACQ